MSAWSNEAAVDRLKVLWADGNSARDIANVLNREFPGFDLSRNSIIGKVHRMGLQHVRASAPKKANHNIGRKGAAALARARAATAAQPHPWTPKAKPAPQPKGVMVLVPQKGSDPVANRLQNMAARANPAEDVVIRSRAFAPLAGCEPVPFGHGGCKWPAGLDGASMLQCGQGRAEGVNGVEPYCAAHCKAAYKPRTVTPAKAARDLIRSVRRAA